MNNSDEYLFLCNKKNTKCKNPSCRWSDDFCRHTSDENFAANKKEDRIFELVGTNEDGSKVFFEKTPPKQ